MNQWMIYHNPRCTKSREALQLLQDHGIEPMIIEYLKLPPSEKMLRNLAEKMGLSAKDMIRSKEKAFKEMDLDLDDEDGLFAAMAEEPVLIERPIVLRGVKAVLGRPPEKVKELFDAGDLARGQEIAAAKATPSEEITSPEHTIAGS